jgi:trans-aconitate 2-methyltransferase
MSSSEFYDNFVSYQIDSGINDRIYSLYKRVSKIGISNHSNILEIGCGIGTMTYLLSRRIKKGSIVALDISPKSIEYAKAHLSRPNVEFLSSDILKFEPKISSFDKILLFDVIEHIPEANHVDLFEKIFKWMDNQSLLLINFPNPNYILFEQKNNPLALQEIDQPIFIDRLAGVLAKLSLEISYLKNYSVWVKDDYHFLVIKKRTEFVKKSLSADRSSIEKLKLRLSRVLRKIMYNYPVD